MEQKTLLDEFAEEPWIEKDTSDIFSGSFEIIALQTQKFASAMMKER